MEKIPVGDFRASPFLADLRPLRRNARLVGKGVFAFQQYPIPLLDMGLCPVFGRMDYLGDSPWRPVALPESLAGLFPLCE